MKLDKYIDLSHKISQLNHERYMEGLARGCEEYEISQERSERANELFKEILNELMEEVG